MDEPLSTDKFPELAKTIKDFRKADHEHVSYINMIPRRGKWLEEYIESVKPELLSYDYYQWWWGMSGSLWGEHSGHYAILEQFRKTALDADRWNFYPGRSPDDNNKGICYNQMMNTIKMALNNLQQQNLDYTIKAIIWVQGEQDSKNEISASRYAQNLKKFHYRLCKDLNIKPVVLLYTELLPHEPPAPRFTHRDQIRLSQKNSDADSRHPDSMPNAYMVKTEGCPVYDDLVHYTTQGQMMLGERLAKKIQKEN